MATLASAAAERYGDGPAAKFRRNGEWQSLTFAEMGRRVSELARGLIDLGIETGGRVAILSNTRVEFTVANLAVNAAGAIAVPVYPSNSADECAWVVGDSGAEVIVVEDAGQAAKIAEVRGELPALRHVVAIDGAVDGTPTIDEVAERGSGRDESELADRAARISGDDPCLIIYTSGTTGRPKGVVLTNKGFAAGRRSSAEMNLIGAGDTVYLYLPLAHVFGQLVQAAAMEVGATIAYWGGDANQIVAELGQVHPTILPSVPRIFEKVYAVATGMIPEGGEAAVAASIDLGVKVRDARLRGIGAEPIGEATKHDGLVETAEPAEQARQNRAGASGPAHPRAQSEVSPAEAEAFEQADAGMFELVRGIFGGEMRLAISGAAPIAAEVLRFFYAAGVPVMEGWGMTETTGIGTVNLPDAKKFGTIGRPVAGADIRIADDGEIEMRGDLLLREYWRNPQATADVMTDDGYLRTGDIGSIDEDGFVSIIGRKKDIIITAGGKNLTPANLEGDLRRSRWVSQAVMFGDRRPYPVAILTLDAEEVVPWADKQGHPSDLVSLAQNDELIAMIQAELDAANAKYARVEQIKKFRILDRDFTVESGELTPSLKLKRNVVYERCAADFTDLYGTSP